MMDVAVILILITLASTFIGTLWRGTRTGKALILVLAVFAGGAAIYQSIETKKSANESRRMLAGLIQAVQPPAFFDRLFIDTVMENAKQADYWVSGQSIDTESNARLIEIRKSGEGKDDLAGYVLFSEERMQDLFLAYVRDEPNRRKSGTGYVR